VRLNRSRDGVSLIGQASAAPDSGLTAWPHADLAAGGEVGQSGLFKFASSSTSSEMSKMAVTTIGASPGSIVYLGIASGRSTAAHG